MNLHSKPYIFIGILCLIAVLIAGMYLELVANVMDFNHAQIGVVSDQISQRINSNDESSFSMLPVTLYSMFVTDQLSPVSAYPPPQSMDKELYLYPYPAAASPAP